MTKFKKLETTIIYKNIEINLCVFCTYGFTLFEDTYEYAINHDINGISYLLYYIYATNLKEAFEIAKADEQMFDISILNKKLGKYVKRRNSKTNTAVDKNSI